MQVTVLSAYNINKYLQNVWDVDGKSFLDSEMFFHGNFEVEECIFRNRTFYVNKNNQYSPKLFLKQSSCFDNRAIDSIQNEAQFYNLFSQSKFPFIPKFKFYDDFNKIIILELEAGESDLKKIIYSHIGIDNNFPESISIGLGKLLSILYLSLKKENLHAFTNLFECKIPWILTLNQKKFNSLLKNKIYDSHLPALILNNKKIEVELKEILKQWKYTHLTHNDIKFDNFISSNLMNDIKIVDWEMCDIGDFRWDIAAIIVAFLSLMLEKKIAQETTWYNIKLFLISYNPKIIMEPAELKYIFKVAGIIFIQRLCLLYVDKIILSNEEEILNLSFKMLFKPEEQILKILND